jgi:hypothetical protein
VLTDRPLTDWSELTRVEQKSPLIVSHTSIAIAGKQVLVVFGRCVHLPFGSVSYADKVRIGQCVAAQLPATTITQAA